MEAFIIGLAAKYPVVVSILGGIGLARIVFKPIMVAIEQIVVQTPSAKDNELLAKVLASKVYKYLSFALDYVGSIKLPQASQPANDSNSQPGA